MKKPSCIIWDWNGTLIDDAALSCECVNNMLERYNHSKITLEQYRDYVDSPITKFYERVFSPGEITFEQISKEYNEYYRAHMSKLCLSKNALETLHFFKAEGVKQLIISASHRSYIETLTKKFNIGEIFDAIIASDDYVVSGKLERAEAFFRQSEINPESCLAIGDTRHDSDMAKLLGTKCLLFSGGHESREKLESSNIPVSDTISPDVICSLFKADKND